MATAWREKSRVRTRVKEEDKTLRSLRIDEAWRGRQLPLRLVSGVGQHVRAGWLGGLMACMALA